ncbi:MAG: hypothetical protein GDA48_29315 [Hormoscilla sp. GM102CHS1]|nr:hypothetical protein [Hormoscilla sp. GM102CHS1]
MTKLQTILPTDIWVVAPWDEYIQMIDDRPKAKGYYRNGRMRIETMPIGPNHAKSHGIIIFAVNLFCTLKNIPFNGLDNCSYRKAGVRECQPDVSYSLFRKQVEHFCAKLELYSMQTKFSYGTLLSGP